jgi:hypothetical protein
MWAESLCHPATLPLCHSATLPLCHFATDGYRQIAHASRFDEAFANRESGKLHAVVDIQFLHQAIGVILHGFD